jgi:hypothetical protein
MLIGVFIMISSIVGEGRWFFFVSRPVRLITGWAKMQIARNLIHQNLNTVEPYEDPRILGEGYSTQAW